MKQSPSVPVIFTARVVFHHDDDRALLELDPCEHVQFLIYRLQIVQVAMNRVESLRRMTADVPEL